MNSKFFVSVSALFATACLVGISSQAHAGLLEDLRGAVNSVREVSNMVKEVKGVSGEVTDLMPEGEEEPATPHVAAPPPANAAPWYVSIDGQSAGPYGAAKMGALIGQGSVSKDSLVWKEGMGAWQPASAIPELSELFPAGPPPMPGS